MRIGRPLPTDGKEYELRCLMKARPDTAFSDVSISIAMMIADKQ